MRVRKSNHIMNILQIILALLMVASILYFILGELFMPSEKTKITKNCRSYDKGWVQVLSDGTKKPVVVPGEYDVKPGDVLTIEKTMSDISEDTWICIRSSQQDIFVYVDDELREKYSTKDTRRFGKNSVSSYVFIPINKEDRGKNIKMEITSNSPYSGYINSIYEGNRADIWKNFVTMYMPGTLVALFMMLLSMAVVCYSGIIRYFYKRKMEIIYLGGGLLLVSIWLISESRLRQLLLPNSSIASDVGFLMVMLFPYPFLTFMNSIQKRRYQNMYMLIAIASIVNFVGSTFLQIMNIMDFSETMLISHIIVVILILTIFVTVFLDIKNVYIADYPEVAFGILGLMCAGLYEIVLVYKKSSMYNGIGLCMGFVFLLLTAGLKTGRDMLKIEKEKQMAIVANDSKAKFLANMSHEIRTPINTVIGMNEMILRENKDATVHEYATNIQQASRMLLELINEVLDFSKIEAGKLEITETPYHLSSILNDVLMSSKIRAQSKQLELCIDIDKEMPSVLSGDEIRIKQILNNLLSNAIKYTEKGSVTFSVKGAVERDQFALVVSIKDTGRGIRKEDLEHLFDSFQRLEMKKNRYIEGTGLGLSITKQLVDRMCGTIEVKSQYGTGTTFTVHIPQKVVEEKAIGDLQQAYKNADEEKGTSEQQVEKYFYAPNSSVLVVDDNKMNLKVVEALLKRSKIQLDFALGGEESLELMKNKKYDLILMDHMMPEPDGVETLHRLRADKDNLNQDTNVIVLTANAIAGAAEEYIKEGFQDYLSKPVTGIKLEQMLAKYLKNEF